MLFIQLAAVLFAAAFALQNVIPVTKMRDHGASLQEEKDYHLANLITQVIFAATVAHIIDTGFWSFLFFLVWMGLLQWLTFDIVLNIYTKHEWDYVGETAKTDKLLRRHLGEHAGMIKAVVCFFLIVLFNILYATL